MKTTKNYIIEGNKILAKTDIILQESFKSGTSSTIVEKLGHVINNKLGTRFEFSDVPLEYFNSYGSFAGFLGYDSSSDLYIKINFLLSGSDSIESFDMYLDGFSDTPTYTVDTNGLNIIQIVDTITENLIDDGIADEDLLESTKEISNKKLLEKGNLTDDKEVERIISIWVSEDKNILKDLQKLPFPEIYNGAWNEWVSDKPNYYGVKYYLFAKSLKMYLIKNGMVNKTLKPRKKGTVERKAADPVMESQFDDLIDSISVEEKFAFLRGAIRELSQGNINSLIVTGSPGSGKTYTTLEELDKAGVEYTRYTGGVKHVEDLIRILYNKRDREIIVLDDFDSAWRNEEAANILKAALDNKDNREITFVDTKANKNMSDIPPKWLYEGYIIFISNSTKIDSAVASRSVVINLTLTNEEMVEKIENTLKDYRPDLPMDIKKKALEYLKEINPGVSVVDFRTLDNILVAMRISKENWKKMALYMIKNYS
jgi:hypothetical protein